MLALTGFHYSAVGGVMQFAQMPEGQSTAWFWSTGYAWGTIKNTCNAGKNSGALEVAFGTLKLREIRIGGEAVYADGGIREFGEMSV